MTAMDDASVRWEYFQCPDGVGRIGTDGPVMPPIPDGCVEITEEQYLELRGEVRANNEVLIADMHAADAKAEDDRITDLVATKVAEILAAQNGSPTP